MIDNTQPLVSIMMPVYNGVDTLPLALASLQAQTYSNWLCIIVNDGSNDGTKEYLEGLTDSRYHIVHFPENKGRPYARQAALDAATGKYLAYLDADDFYHPKKLEIQVKCLEENKDVDLVSCGMGSYGSEFDLITVKGKKEHGPTVYKMSQSYYPARAACMIRLNRARDIQYNLKLKYAQDTDYFTRYINMKKYMVVSDILYYYSEFTSVNVKKVLKTYLHGVNRGMGIIGDHFAAGAKLVVLSYLKWSYMSVKTLFMDHESFIKSRGQAPDASEKLEFKEIIKSLTAV